MTGDHASGTATGRLLVVEDDDAIRRLLSDALGDEGHEVQTASTGLEALALLGTWTPQLILLDLGLPEMDGEAFRNAQRQLPPPASAIPVILVTGAHRPASVVEELDAISLIRKPFDLDYLVTFVGEQVAARAANAEQETAEG